MQDIDCCSALVITKPIMHALFSSLNKPSLPIHLSDKGHASNLSKSNKICRNLQINDGIYAFIFPVESIGI